MPGFPVFGTGQPTLGGFDKCLEPIMKKYGDEKKHFLGQPQARACCLCQWKALLCKRPRKASLPSYTQGAPNFRRMPGFPVFGTGQPTLGGFDKCLEPIM